MKFLKEKKGIILSFIIGVILASGIVYAATSARDVSYTTEKNGKIENVEQALNDLYGKVNNDYDKINFPYVEGIWSTSAQTMNYTHTATEEAIYIADASAVPNAATITTTGTVIAEYSHNFGKMKIIKANKDDVISISGTSNSYNAGGYIVRVKGLDIDELIASSYNSDTTVQSTYTAVNETEKLLIIAFATGRDRSESIQFSGKNKVSFYHQNNCYITTALLPKDIKVTASATANMFSTAQTYIFKLK